MTLKTDKIFPKDGKQSGAYGGIIQVATASYSTAAAYTSVAQNTGKDLGFTCSITPRSSSNVILINFEFQVWYSQSGTNTFYGYPYIYRKIDSGSYSDIFNTTNASYVSGTEDEELSWYIVNSHLDSPATTGTLTYKLTWYHQSPNSVANMVIGRNSAPSRITLMELSA